jgi:hypothetical protein
MQAQAPPAGTLLTRVGIPAYIGWCEVVHPMATLICTYAGPFPSFSGAVVFRPSLAAAEAAAVSALNAAVSAVAGLPRLARGGLAGPGLAAGQASGGGGSVQQACGGAGTTIPVTGVADPDVAAAREVRGRFMDLRPPPVWGRLDLLSTIFPEPGSSSNYLP